MDKGHHDSGTGGPHGMSQTDTRSVDIGDLPLKPQLALAEPIYWAANASLTSSSSKSPIAYLLRSIRLFTAGTGESPMMAGWQAPRPTAVMRASGVSLSAAAFSADIITMAAAPSLMPLLLPAVTEPPLGIKAGGKALRSSRVSPRPVMFVTIKTPGVFFFFARHFEGNDFVLKIPPVR